ncbi:MAG: molecular chaperone TorD family protein [Betaproteobacteria bacterium]|nr:molecular chaperone TorD family protein [Betaproteobacteria bacterium]
MNETPPNLNARAEFYLCLARALMPPREDAAYDAFKQHLADDLRELAAELGYPAAGALHDLRDAVARLPDHLTLLQGYSRLFLAPPAPVPLNAGLYLDGAVMGPATLALEKCYRVCDLKPGGQFHDLPDHIALQLEFVAYLCASEAAGGTPALRADDFLASFVRYWVPPFAAALERACTPEDPARIYLCLARLLQIAVDHELRDYHPARGQISANACDEAALAGSSPA